MKMRKMCAIAVSMAMAITAIGSVSAFAEDNPYANPYEAPAEDSADADNPYANPYAAPADNADSDNPYANPYAAPADGADSDNPYANPYAAPAEGGDSDNPYANPYAAPAEGGEEGGDNPYANPYAAPAEGGEEGGDNPYANPYADPNAEDTAAAEGEAAAAEDYIPEAGEKYTVEVTADGWVKIVNEDGATLGLSTYSGVKIVEADGYAFKDLNGNGELDAYEDWRLSTEERAADLVAQMSGAELAAVLSHGGWGDFTTEPLAEGDGSLTFLQNGGRGGVTRQIRQGGGAHAKWANAIQAAAEGCFYGIPAMISIDPANISGLIETLSLASTMDPELAAEIGKETAKQYRAAGVTALLGPQVDIASPVMNRAGGTYGEDPKLTLDIATAYVNAMQSTYDADGNDLGWGDESVFCFTKHFAGAGSTEGGRDDHSKGGRYAVFPGDNFEAHLITYFDGVFNLPGETKSSGIMTEYAVNVDGEGKAYGGEEWAGAYSAYQYDMLNEFGYDNLIITDWGTQGDFGAGDATGTWGSEGMTVGERMALQWKRGANLLGGNGNFDAIAEAYGLLADELGEDGAKELLGAAAYRFFVVMLNLNMFEQPYCDSAYADEIVFSESAEAYGLETQRQSVAMIKNDGVLTGEAVEMPTVYVPYVFSTGFSVSWMQGINPGTPSWTPGMDLDILSKYFNIVTDTPTEDGIERASEEEIAGCDYILVGMTAPYSLSYDSHATAVWVNYEDQVAAGEIEDVEEVWYPYSLQYAEYTADTARDPSISGLTLEDGSKENRSFKGNTAPADANYGHLEALEYAASAAGDIPVIVSMKMDRPMVWTEVEPLADVIFVSYNNQKTDVVAEMILGQTEPDGHLVFQQPVSMEAVEAQLEDVPRDLECYVDAAGNAYDFGFGMNWAGALENPYGAEPLTKVENYDYAAYAEANS